MRILLYLLSATLFVFAQGEQRYADGSASDQDGNSFEWINYGTQDWSIENAEVVTYRDGTEIPQVTDEGIWTDLTTGAWCYFDNDPSKGKLYNAYAIIGRHDNDENTPNKEFAPEGWHVPSNSEWGTLESYLIVNRYNYDQTNTGNKIALSMTSNTGWNPSEIQGSPGYDQSIGNKSGFNAPPDGFKNPLGDFQNEGLYAAWWSHVDYSLSSLFYITITNASINLSRNPSDVPSYGNSVRFVRDAVDTEAPVITLLGPSQVYVNQGATYTDEGATASDNVDGDITANITVTSTVDLSTVGTYTVTYNVSDAAGNAATPVERAVNVLGTQRYADGTATDQNGNSFEWINYGTQDWAIENAEVVTYRDGTEIPQVTDNGIWENLTTGAWCYYDNDPAKGKLYNWYAVAGIHNIASRSDLDLRKEFAPEGWQVPSNSESGTLESYLIAKGYNYDQFPTGNKIAKSMASTTGWDSSPITGAPGKDQNLNNRSGFNAIPEGYRRREGTSDFEGSAAPWWCSSDGGIGSSNANYYSLFVNSTHFDRSANLKQTGYSVRFVRDAVDTEPPVITINGATTVSVNQGATYTDEGATASDNVDGDITANITVTSTVDLSTVGTYTVTYNVSDAAGNAATPVVRTITVNPVQTNPTETGILLNGTVSAENNQIKNVADPTDAQDAVTKTFIENFIKNSVSMEFFEWNISKVNADNQTIQLSSKPFVFVNAANTTIILPDESQVSEMDVIYIYSLRGTNNATIEDCAITFTSNSHPISSYKLGDGLITASVGQKIYGRFPSSGLKTIVFIDGQWFIGNFSPYSILD